jgi:hypothetical protein
MANLSEALRSASNALLAAAESARGEPERTSGRDHHCDECHECECGEHHRCEHEHRCGTEDDDVLAASSNASAIGSSPPYPPYPPLPPNPPFAPYPPFPPYPPYVVIASGSGCGCACHSAHGQSPTASATPSTYLAPSVAQPWPSPTSQAVGAASSVADPGLPGSQLIGLAFEPGESFPDPSSLTNLDALLSLSEQAVNMVRDMVPRVGEDGHGPG